MIKSFAKHVQGFYESDDHEAIKPAIPVTPRYAPLHSSAARHYQGTLFSPLTLLALKHKYQNAYEALTRLAAYDGLTEKALMRLTLQPDMERKLELALKHAEILIDLVQHQGIPLASIFESSLHQVRILLSVQHSTEKDALLENLARVQRDDKSKNPAAN